MQAEGVISEIRLLPDEVVAAWISCPNAVIPEPGQYVLAHILSEEDAPLAAPLFLAERGESGFLTVSQAPLAWMPGTRLKLRGPLGHGFRLPDGSQRLALVSLGDTAMRLSPLIVPALERGMGIAFLSDQLIPAVPAAVEIYPLHELPEAMAWVDFIALEIHLDRLNALRSLFGLTIDQALPCQAQALILAEMPCGGLAECGACTVPARRKWKLACSDGPVFNLADLDW
jgi:NAD(P)H-flavin reductase